MPGTARDKAVWKVRVKLRTLWNTWDTKTYFYSRESVAKRWLKKAVERPEDIQIDFYGKYVLQEEDSA